MNYGEMKLELSDMFGTETNPGPKVSNKYGRWINTIYKELLGRKGLGKLRNTVQPMTTVANDPFAVIPQAVSKIRMITDRLNGIPLSELGIERVRVGDPTLLSFSSTPWGYVQLNLAAAVARDPSAASELFVKSSSALDTAGQGARLEVVITGGYTRFVSIALNGTTAVSIDSTLTTIVSVTKFYLTNPAYGNVTLHQTSGAGTELARIPTGRQYSRYSRIMLFPTPSTSLTYYVDGWLSLYPLEIEVDEPIFPEDYDWLLPSGAITREFLNRGKMLQYRAELDRFNRGYSQMVARLAQMSGPVYPNRGFRFSQLGPWFPVGS